jgi:hypothetical protein
MERSFRRWVRFVVAGLVGLVLAGCSTLRPITTEPPASTIVLTAPFSIEQMSKATFPAGEYRALCEDDGGYYYQAPTKIVANALFSYLYEGGLYVKRGEDQPTEWYIIGQGSRLTRGQLKTIPPHQMKR